mmetsp:Transcript_19952/g.55463  ORF Transcript_19952/g.55463 Transcript_19952/m.55463 type:complete len:513 (-) Transcript_19952:397-1935(-)|eukprot:CAMPEP_0117682544 /NCGR_PEP_ID=MMETSP0804-20121206/19737_1 /TAXON_ID=1074897 /ORGANISM="Tetraselmis astigmatica, Strain CCMP880" /LENGTH=512 /DNA_ID=CAMNT_0005492705 /DNA_START=154 /DNA_END=1692 /DNA_ORIENTATION=+
MQWIPAKPCIYERADPEDGPFAPVTIRPTAEQAGHGDADLAPKKRQLPRAEDSMATRVLLTLGAILVAGGTVFAAKSLAGSRPLLLVDALPQRTATLQAIPLCDQGRLQRLYPHTTLRLDNGLGRTPALGWNSWNTLACSVDEEAVMAAADLMVSLGLKDAGYKYVNVDDCWQGDRLPNGTITADPEKFPSGMKALAEYVHSLGLKFGIYSDAGHKTCAGRPGSWTFEQLDAQAYADWGVDYLKYDNCYAEDLPGPKVRYPIMRDALNATGKPILYSMCEWGREHPSVWATPVGNSWRTTADIEPAWASVMDILLQNDAWAQYAGPGGFNDPDMLEVGVPGNAWGDGLSPAEERSHFALWALVKSPLLIGADLRCIPAHSLTLLKNTEIIAVNQDPLGIQGRKVHDDPENGDGQVWAAPLEGNALAVALLNTGSSASNIFADLTQLGFPDGVPVSVRDLLGRSDLGLHHGRYYEALVEPHDVHFVRLELQPGTFAGANGSASVRPCKSPTVL